MTVREINRQILIRSKVVAQYRYPDDTTIYHGRITQARRRLGFVEVKSLNTGRWALLEDNESARVVE